MIIICNKSNNTLKSFELVVKNGSLSITKTEADCPISDVINIDLSNEINSKNKTALNIKLTYKNGKAHSIQSSNYNINSNIEITTYGANKKLGINTSNTENKTEVISKNLENYKIIDRLVNQYMEDHLIDNKITAKDNAENAKQSSLLAKEYMDKAKEYSDKALKTTASGYEELVDDVDSLKSIKGTNLVDNKTSEGSILINKIYGQTEIDPFVDGENIYKCVDRTETIAGVTITESTDGSVTFNGKCTKSSSYHFATRDGSQNKSPLDLKTDTIYKVEGVSYFVNDSESFKVRLLTNYTNNKNEGVELGCDWGGGSYFNFKSDYTKDNQFYKGVGFLVNFYEGAEFNDYKIYPRIIEVKKNIIPSPYTPIKFNNSMVKFTIENDTLIAFPHSGHKIADYPINQYNFNGITYKIGTDGIVTMNGKTSRDTDSAVNIISPYNYGNAKKLVLGQTYYISDGRADEGFHTNGYIQFIRIKKDGTLNWYGNTANGTLVYTHTDPEYVKWGVRVCALKGGAICENVVVKPMVSVMAGDNFTKNIVGNNIKQSLEYKEYKSTTLNTDIILSAIQVPNNYADYNLDIGGTHYVADTLERTENGYQIVRRVGIRDNLKCKHLGTNNSYCAISEESLNVDDFVQADMSQGYIYGEMNCFVKADGGLATYKGDNGNGTYCIVEDKPRLRLYIRNDNCTSKEDWEEYLNSQNVVFRGILKTPIIEDVSAEDVQKLLSVKSFDGVTYITQVAEVDAIIEAEYATNRKTALVLTGYTQAEKNKIQLKELQTAIFEMASI